MAMFGPHTIQEKKHHLELTEMLVNYHDSGAYKRDVDRVGQKALDYLDTLPSDKPEQAIVLDLDETSWFNNWPAFINPETKGDPGKDAAWNEWVAKACAPAIPTSLELVTLARKKDIEVFFITGRYETAKADTEKNLVNAGYQGWKDLYLYPKSADSDRSLVFPEAATYKTAVRWQITRSGYEIVLNMGDQESDITGGFASKTFKLPNPFYTVI
ncbi:MAG: HAD family acid phosphatase [Desulfobacterales bacterium]|nr:HAD family acid phosphatase [Desulfobacterales bacterium]